MNNAVILILLTSALLASCSAEDVGEDRMKILKGRLRFPKDIQTSQYPPFKGCYSEAEGFKKYKVPTFVIDLDKNPEERWSEVVTTKKTQIFNLLNSFKNHTDELFGVKFFELVDKYLPALARTLPNEYYRELQGISKATNIPLGEVTLFNLFYEFFSVCTSIILEGSDGRMYHGRNLDFGLFLGWDVKNSTWLTSEYLRPLVVQLEFSKSGTKIYTAVNFAGYVGILTAVKKNAFSLSVNERFVLNGGYIGLAEWILGRRNLNWMGILTRDVFLAAENYKSAQKILIQQQLVAPVYFILAGNKSHQGCIITRDHKDYDVWSLGQRHQGQKGEWYLVQTNYDHWNSPPFYDNRRNPAVTCMEKNGQNKPLETLRNVLSTRPVLNKLTTYTAIMEVNSGDLHIQIQNCKNPCWPW